MKDSCIDPGQKDMTQT